MNFFHKSLFLVCSIVLIGGSCKSEKLSIFYDEDEETCSKDESRNCKRDPEEVQEEDSNPDNVLIVPDELAPYVDKV